MFHWIINNHTSSALTEDIHNCLMLSKNSWLWYLRIFYERLSSVGIYFLKRSSKLVHSQWCCSVTNTALNEKVLRLVIAAECNNNHGLFDKIGGSERSHERFESCISVYVIRQVRWRREEKSESTNEIKAKVAMPAECHQSTRWSDALFKPNFILKIHRYSQWSLWR